MNKTVNVDLGERSYPIYIGPALLGQASYLQPHIKGKQVLVVSNETVAPLYLEKTLAALAGYEVATCILPDGEQYKNLDILNRVFDELLGAKFNRQVTLIALGGGVVGDITGFAAASYQRGVQFIQIPTTLLAQVDSSVGGKTGVNHRLGKNMIGAFFQPQCVLADTDTLNTLDDRQLSAGMAEVIKYGLIRDAEFFDWLAENMGNLLARDTQHLIYAIERSCLNKAEVVEADEKEAGQRALPNLGHTFGHAIETGAGYGQVLHGEAVAIGMLMAADLSVRLGWMEQGQLSRVQDLIKQANLPSRPPRDMTSEQFIELMAVDKKVIDGQLRLVLLRDIGRAEVSADFATAQLLQTLADFTH